MEPEQQIAQACKILGRNEPAVKRRVAYAVSIIEMRKEVKKPGARYGTTMSGREKEAAKALDSVLRKLLTLLKSNNLAPNLRPGGRNSPFTDEAHCRTFFEEWRQRADVASATKFNPKDNAKIWAKLEAARFALRLLQSQGLRASVAKLKEKRTRYQRLAALLNNTPDQSLRSACELALKEDRNGR